MGTNKVSNLLVERTLEEINKSKYFDLKDQVDIEKAVKAFEKRTEDFLKANPELKEMPVLRAEIDLVRYQIWKENIENQRFDGPPIGKGFTVYGLYLVETVFTYNPYD